MKTIPTQKPQTSERKILPDENKLVNIENDPKKGFFNNKNQRLIFVFEILSGLFFLFVGFVDTDRFGSYFFIIFALLIFVIGLISLASHPSMFSKYLSFIGLGIILFFVIVWVFGFLVKNINPAFRPFSEDVSLDSLGWKPRQTQTAYVQQTSISSKITGIVGEPSSTNTPTQTATQTPTYTSTFTQIPSPTETPAPFLGFLFCVKDKYLWAIPINEYPMAGTQIGAIEPKKCIRFDGITSDGKWLRLSMDQSNIIRFPYARELGYVTSDGLSDKEINRNALPIIESTPYPN